MHEPLRLVAIDGDGRVMATGLLMPARVAWMRGSRWILELPVHHPSPPHGATLRGVVRRPQPTTPP